LGDLVLYTGWTFEQVGSLTMPQLRSVLAAVNRRRKEQIEMMGGKVSGGEKEVDGTIAIEQRLKLLKARTGKTTFDLRDVI
jgi:hypothetical protein